MPDSTSLDLAFAPAAGTALFWEQRGVGEPILLIHAGIADSRMWEPQFLTFSNEYQVIRYDWRGMGRTPLGTGPFAHHDDVIAVLDAAGVDRAHLIGISMGGTIALETAFAYPERVHSLVIGASSPRGLVDHTNLVPVWDQIDSLIEAGDIDAANELEVQMWVDGPIRQPADVDPALRALVAEMNRASLTADRSDVEQRELDPPAAQRLGDITVPTLVLAGEYDQPSSIAGPMLLGEQIPQAEYHLLPGVAHLLNMERPEQFDAVVLDFLRQHPLRVAAG